MDDVERVVRVGQRAAVGGRDLQVAAEVDRRVELARRFEDLGPAVQRDGAEIPTPGGSGIQDDERDIDGAGTDVEQ